MARKTIMKKEPTVSVALPNSEKERLGMPTRPPVRQQLQRLSPGVYRNQMGQLTTSTGRALPRRNPQQQLGNRISDAMNQQPQQRPDIATRPPAPLGSPAGDSFQQPGATSAIPDTFGQVPQMPARGQFPLMPGITPEQWAALQAYMKQNMQFQSASTQPSMPPMQPPNNNMNANPRMENQEQYLMPGQGLPQYNPFGNYLADMYSQVQQKPLTPEMSQQQFDNLFQQFGNNRMALGPRGQQMSVQQLEQMKQQNPNMFTPITFR